MGQELIYDRGAPGTIFNVGVLAAAAGAGAVYAIPDDSAGLVAGYGPTRLASLTGSQLH